MKMHTTLDVVKTGQRIRKAIPAKGYTVREMQELLSFECPQSIYRWFHGKTMPTIDSLFALSKILDMHMEDLLVAREIKEKVPEIPEKQKGIWD